MDSSNSTTQTQETKICLKTQETGFLALFREALRIPLRNIRFTCFILFTSLPLLFLMIFFETLVEKKLQKSLKVVPHSTPAPESWRSSKLWLELYQQNFWDKSYEHFYTGLENLTKIFSEKILLMLVIYLIALPILEYLATYFTIYFASKAYKNDPRWTNNNIRNKHKFKHLKGFLVTSLIVLALSSALFLGFVLLFIALCSSNLISINDVIVILLYISCLVFAMPKYLEANALWNLSLVVSVLGDIHGIDAFYVSLRFSKGKEKVGSCLMLVFFVWGFVFRVSCMVFNDGMVGIVGRSSLLWLGFLMKWVVCVVYFYQCMGTVFEKRMADDCGGSHGGEDKERVPEERVPEKLNC